MANIDLIIDHLKNILSWSTEIYCILNNSNDFSDNNNKQLDNLSEINSKIEWIIFATQSAIEEYNESK